MKNTRIMKAFSILLILLVVGGLAGVSAGEASMDINQSKIDELTGLNFDYWKLLLSRRIRNFRRTFSHED
jgi:hypothetical protein